VEANMGKEERTLELDSDLGYDRETPPRGFRRDPVNYSANELKGLEKVGLIEL
jgi:hypothetical protein